MIGHVSIVVVVVVVVKCPVSPHELCTIPMVQDTKINRAINTSIPAVG